MRAFMEGREGQRVRGEEEGGSTSRQADANGRNIAGGDDVELADEIRQLADHMRSALSAGKCLRIAAG